MKSASAGLSSGGLFNKTCDEMTFHERMERRPKTTCDEVVACVVTVEAGETALLCTEAAATDDTTDTLQAGAVVADGASFASVSNMTIGAVSCLASFDKEDADETDETVVVVVRSRLPSRLRFSVRS
jgi:hypothetical protein